MKTDQTKCYKLEVVGKRINLLNEKHEVIKSQLVEKFVSNYNEEMEKRANS